MDARHVCCSGPLQWHGRTDSRRLSADGGVSQRERHGACVNREFACITTTMNLSLRKWHGERTAMDLLLSELDSNVVTLCFDAGWAQRAGTGCGGHSCANTAPRIGFSAPARFSRSAVGSARSGRFEFSGADCVAARPAESEISCRGAGSVGKSAGRYAHQPPLSARLVRPVTRPFLFAGPRRNGAGQT